MSFRIFLLVIDVIREIIFPFTLNIDEIFKNYGFLQFPKNNSIKFIQNYRDKTWFSGYSHSFFPFP